MLEELASVRTRLASTRKLGMSGIGGGASKGLVLMVRSTPTARQPSGICSESSVVLLLVLDVLWAS